MLEPLSQAEGIEADGTLYVLYGGMRARMREETLTFASDIAYGGLLGSARVTDGWLFAARDGALYHSGYFTGPMTRVGQTDGAHLESAYVSTGRLTVRDESRNLWIGSREGLRRANFANGLIIDAGFVTDRFGLAVLSPGQLLRTRDGGLGWEPMSLGGQAALEVLPEGEGFVVRTRDSQWRVTAHGAPVPFEGIAAGWDYRGPDAQQLRQALLRDGPAPRAKMLMRDSFALGDRVYVSLSPRPSNERLGALMRGHHYGEDQLGISRVGEDLQRVDPPGLLCRYLPLRDRLLAICRDATMAHQAALYVGDGIEPWLALPTSPSMLAWGSLATSNDGVGIWQFSACDGRASADSTRWCHFDGTSWHNVDVDRRATFVAAYGPYVVFQSSEGLQRTGLAVPLRVQRIGDRVGGSRILRPSIAMERGAFTSDGTFWALGSRGQERYLVLGNAHELLNVRPLPPNTRELAMATALRGVAVGTDPTHTQITEDGGIHWQPVRLAAHEPHSTHRVAPLPHQTPPRVFCTAYACSVENLMVWASESLIGQPPPRVLTAAVTPHSAAAVTASASPSGMSFPSYRCGATEVQAQGAPVHRMGTGGWIQTQPTGWSWGGHNAQGPFSARTTGAFPTFESVQAPVSSSQWFARWVSGQTALIERCFATRNAMTPQRCDLAALTRSHPPTALTSTDWLTRPQSHGFSFLLRALYARDATHFVLHYASGALDDTTGLRTIDPRSIRERRADVIVRVDSNGRIESTRSFVWAEGELEWRALAIEGAREGLVILPARPPHTLHFIESPETPARPLSPVPTRLRICSDYHEEIPANSLLAITQADAHNVRIFASVGPSNSELTGHDGVRTELSFDHASWCIRRVSVEHSLLGNARNQLTISRLGPLDLEAHGGELRVRPTGPRGERSIECAPSNARP